jgi:rod shape-determining protein MreC
MQIDRTPSLFSLKTKSKKTLYSNYSFVFFVILSITLITFDIKNIINSSVIRSNIINSIFFTKDFFSFNLPNLDKLKLSFISKEELILENKYLKEKIEQSNLFKLKSEKLEIENNILRKELSLLPPVLENYVFVKVTADTQTRYNKTIIINAGKNRDIRKGDAALTFKGLIGSVFEVYEKYSRVLLISDINSKIPVRVGESNIKAIISGNNTTKIDLLYLKENLSFNDNDLVYTSGDGGYFNPGIPVGILRKENSIIYIDPLNDLSQIQYINIYINQFKNF